MELFIEIFEVIGTIAFAISGSVIAIRRDMDIFGVCVMSVITACGGGVMRDLFLGQLPPTMFVDPVYAIASIISGLFMFHPSNRMVLMKKEQIYESVLFAADSIGLGVFSAVGVSASIHAGYLDNGFFTIFLGVITGVGGGVIRDQMAGYRPYIFVKHIYAVASIAGASLCYYLWELRGEALSVLACCILIVIIRVMASHYQWSLPRAGQSNSGKYVNPETDHAFLQD